MRQFCFIVLLFQTNAFLVYKKIKVRSQGGDAEQLTKAEIIRTLSNYMVGN